MKDKALGVHSLVLLTSFDDDVLECSDCGQWFAPEVDAWRIPCAESPCDGPDTIHAWQAFGDDHCGICGLTPADVVLSLPSELVTMGDAVDAACAAQYEEGADQLATAQWLANGHGVPAVLQYARDYLPYAETAHCDKCATVRPVVTAGRTDVCLVCGSGVMTS